VLAYGSVWESGAVAALQEWSVRSVSLHGDRRGLPRRLDLILARERPPSMQLLPFASRLLIGLAFAISGLGKLAAYGATFALIASSKLPLPPPLAYAGVVMIEFDGNTAAPNSGAFSKEHVMAGTNSVTEIIGIKEYKYFVGGRQHQLPNRE
jgi:hypothetical protein